MATKLPPFKTKDMPPFIPNNFVNLNTGAIGADIGAYARSDADFSERHRPILRAEKAFEGGVLKDFNSDPLAPAVQNEFMRSGLSGALGSLGDASTVGGEGGGSLTAGSSGEAALGRGLGNEILAYQDRNRRNRESTLGLAEQIFPRRTIGMSGQDRTLINMLNTAGMNNWNQSWYANKVAQDEFNYRIQAENIAAAAQQQNANAAGSAQQSSSLVSGGASIATALVGALALSCWVARAAYGVDNPKWRIFRRWLLLSAPRILRRNYLRHGEQFAKIISSQFTRRAFSWLMDFPVRSMRRKWSNILSGAVTHSKRRINTDAALMGARQTGRGTVSNCPCASIVGRAPLKT